MSRACVDNFINKFSVKQIIEMFDLMPDVLFWVKDEQNCFVYANKFFLEHIGVTSLVQIIGLRDFDFSPAHMAKQYNVDDQKVMNGEVVNNRLEMNHTKSGDIAWFTTSKRPLFNEEGKPIGSYGITRHLEKTSSALAGMDALKTPVAYVRKNYMQHICLEELADITHLSISALERRFKKFLGKTPKQFINEVRLENARRLLIETNIAIATIANNTGFGDHSYFSRQFQKLFEQSPSAFRQEHCSNETVSINTTGTAELTSNDNPQRYKHTDI
ncbi:MULTISPECIES: AraC family transcriptional regulator [unclassified Colwellia]|uniref:AraC family transcriptional regulator n=1 Tax=unclassified Colwellia TaxID=196834 RepID=UPI0015F5F7D4|nr:MULTISPECIES: AraC family transcriptional regulator [unclassified Colwellia]MBA6234046.1 AraC family transcriptional regulator [Colwellia sp. MB02u-7]MBA6238032.1 AraC family transcriptional regulator [Colwellia sp. MB02u-11]MBA6300720.1 AraC family transcriptional regulator [Colwellia sp. MB3u-22]MBA6304399.1 AraC family transcriptional regulator [Colwellia sp. MB02u-14]MBA6311381.1 AraC family transcriptional regulator [Colwellia sp. MB3u-64]